jgi:hypothetical protein
MRIAYSGSMGRLPLGGHAWADLQWIAGLAALGHDVVYFEECGPDGSWVYDWDREEVTTDLAYPAAFVRDSMAEIGLPGAWIYRTADESAGMAEADFVDFCRDADVLFIRAVPLAEWRDEYTWPRRTIFVDADPGFTQIRLGQGDPLLKQTVGRCDRLFTVGQGVGTPQCPIPTLGLEWVRTKPVVALEHWPNGGGAASHFTTVMQWRGHYDLEHNGRRYGQKDVEFPRFLDLPRLSGQPFRIALTGAPTEPLAAFGWEAEPGWEPSRTAASYRDYIRGSRAEFGVAKQGYVESRSGWFSDRSVCFLASGRPVLLQDTSLPDELTAEGGIVTFDDVDTAVDGVATINGDYEHHCHAARTLAEQIFSAGAVLPSLLEAAA